MKEVEYEELDLKGDEQVFHMWEPLNFEIKDNYKYITTSFILFLVVCFHHFGYLAK